MSGTVSDPSSSYLKLAQSADFQLSDLFFSRTDDRGVIQAGNSVFQRIAEFEWDELVGAPHKIVRHPDMPKAVFWLLWDSLKRGEPIGAYVKNRTKSGLHYWVFAVVMPIVGGYLSVRIKPSSDLLPKVESLYKEIREKENASELEVSPEASAAALIEGIKALGFPNYRAFMAKGLTTELMSSDLIQKKAVDDRLEAFDGMAQAVSEIFDEANALYGDFRRIEQIPVNLRLQASRCEASGGPVSVISANYSNLARDALDFASRFTNFGQDVLDEINMGLFLMGATRLQRQMCDAFQQEDGAETPVDYQREINAMMGHRKRFGEMARSAVARILDRSESFIEDSRRMRRFVGGLDVTRVTCRIETGWLPDDDGGFHDIISKLDGFHEDVERRMKRIDSLNDNIIERASALLNRAARPRVHRTEGAQPPEAPIAAE